MQLKTILNHVERHKSFVYKQARWSDPRTKTAIEILIEPRANSRAVCSGCHGPAPGYDRQPERRFEFVPLWQIAVYSVFPNMLLSLHADYVMVHTLWPESPERTRIECEWLFHPDAAARDGFNPDDGVSFWDATNRQDWRACELSQLGVASRAYTPGSYSPRESIAAAFDRAYLEAM